MKIYTINQIKSVIDLRKDLKELIKIQEKAFVDFSYGLINVPHPIQDPLQNEQKTDEKH